MEKPKQVGLSDSGSNHSFPNGSKVNQSKKKVKQPATRSDSDAKGGEVLLSLPGGFKYQMPGKRQRVILGGLVIGLNFILVLAVLAYYYIPGFQSFVYNFGR